MRKVIAAPVLALLALSPISQPALAGPAPGGPAQAGAASAQDCGATPIAHRGPTDTVVENTTASIHRAGQISSFVEFDLTLTTAGVRVFMHDSTVARVTDGTGPVEHKSLSEIRALNTEPFAGKVMIFADFVESMRTHPWMKVLVEGKRYPEFWRGNRFAFEDMQTDLAGAGLLDRVFFNGSPAFHDSLQQFAPRVGTYHKILGNTPFTVAELNRHHAEVALVSPANANASAAAAVKAQGIKVWSSKTEREAAWRRVVDGGATAVVTDRYHAFVSWCNQYSS